MSEGTVPAVVGSLLCAGIIGVTAFAVVTVNNDTTYDASSGKIVSLTQLKCGMVKGQLSNGFKFAASAPAVLLTLQQDAQNGKTIHLDTALKQEAPACQSKVIETTANGKTTYKSNTRLTNVVTGVTWPA